MIEREGGHGADGGLQDGQIRQSLPHGRQSLRLRPQHVVAAHEKADGHAAKADERSGEGADQSAVAGGSIRLAGPDGLGVGLGAQDPQQQGETGAQILDGPSGNQAQELRFQHAHILDVGHPRGRLSDHAQGGPRQQVVEFSPKPLGAVAPIQYETQAHQGHAAQQQQLHDAAHACAPGAAEDHVEAHEHRGNDRPRPQGRAGEQGGE